MVYPDVNCGDRAGHDLLAGTRRVHTRRRVHPGPRCTPADSVWPAARNAPCSPGVRPQPN